MNRYLHIAVLTLAFGCIGYSTALSQVEPPVEPPEDCWVFDRLWDCGGDNTDSGDCATQNDCEMGACMWLTALLDGPDMVTSYHQNKAPGPFERGNHWEVAHSPFIVCFYLYTCNSLCVFDEIQNKDVCVNWFFIPLGQFDAHLGDECVPVP